jgi:hypothetical protein
MDWRQRLARKMTPEQIVGALNSRWTSVELERVVEWYHKDHPGGFSLAPLALALGKNRQQVARVARHLGLTQIGRAHSDSARANISRAAVGRWRIRPHPRGMAGKKHGHDACAKMSAAQTERGRQGLQHLQLHPMTQARRTQLSALAVARLTNGQNPYSRAKRGRRADLGETFFRSAWEANYARYLNLLVRTKAIVSWQYEARTFWFEKIRRGVRSYTPDFLIQRPNGTEYFVEVKGWMDAKSKTKLKRMKKYHPSVEVQLVGQKAYTEISRKLGGAISGWE